jgi:hypothetical protein
MIGAAGIVLTGAGVVVLAKTLNFAGGCEDECHASLFGGLLGLGLLAIGLLTIAVAAIVLATDSDRRVREREHALATPIFRRL